MERYSYDLDPTAYFAVICAKLNSARRRAGLFWRLNP